MSLCKMQNRKTTLSAAAKTYLQKKEKNSSLCLVWFLHADVSWLPLLSRCVILGTEQCRMCVLSAGTVRHGYTCTLTHRLRNTCLSWIHGNRLQDRISWETICLHFQPLFLLDAVVSDMIRLVTHTSGNNRRFNVANKYYFLSFTCAINLYNICSIVY